MSEERRNVRLGFTDELYPEGVKVKRDESDVGGPIDVDVDTNE